MHRRCCLQAASPVHNKIIIVASSWLFILLHEELFGPHDLQDTIQNFGQYFMEHP